LTFAGRTAPFAALTPEQRTDAAVAQVGCPAISAFDLGDKLRPGPQMPRSVLPAPRGGDIGPGEGGGLLQPCLPPTSAVAAEPT